MVNSQYFYLLFVVTLLALKLYLKNNFTINYAAILQCLYERALTPKFSSLILTYFLKIIVIFNISSLKIKTLEMVCNGSINCTFQDGRI